MLLVVNQKRRSVAHLDATDLASLRPPAQRELLGLLWRSRPQFDGALVQIRLALRVVTGVTLLAADVALGDVEFFACVCLTQLLLV